MTVASNGTVNVYTDGGLWPKKNKTKVVGTTSSEVFIVSLIHQLTE